MIKTQPKTAIEGAIELLGLQAAEADLKARNHFLSIEERDNWHIVAQNKRARQRELLAAYPHCNVLNPCPNVSHRTILGKDAIIGLRNALLIVAALAAVVALVMRMRGCL
jgi:hypothetical protein